MPAYSGYAKRAKIAESYVTIDAIQKAQQSIFYNTGYFIHSMYFAANNGGSPTLPLGGSKFALQPMTGFDHVGPSAPQYATVQAYFQPIIGVVPSGQANYFTYSVAGGFFHPDGEPMALGFNYNSSTGITSTVFGKATGTTSMPLLMSTGTSQECRTTLDFDNLGFSQTPNLHYSTVFAYSNLSGNDCTLVFNSLSAQDGKISKNATVSLDISIASTGR